MRVIIAEKPSVAHAIAQVLGISGSHNGYIGTISPASTVVTWALGHLVTFALPNHYGHRGFKRENLPIMPNPFQLVPKQKKSGKGYVPDETAVKQLQVIKNLFNRCDDIIVATDSGREGELIFRFIYEYLNCQKPFHRLWISSLTNRAIREGFNTLKNGNEFDSLYQSARSRSQADWLIGINASQALSLAVGEGVYSLGRVQTPTLAMICSRYLENKNFESQTYYQIQTGQEVDRKEFKMLSEEKFTDKERAQAVQHRVRGSKMTIIENETKTIREEPPLLYDLTGLQKDANKRYGFSADETLSIAQKLYEKKFITYPRTGSRYISKDIWDEIPTLLVVLLAYSPLREFAKALEKATLNTKCVNDVKVTDHHALLITDNTPSGLSTSEDVIYKMIASRLLEALSQPCEKEITQITGAVNEHRFRARETEVTQPGWRMIQGFFTDDDSLDKVNNDQKLPYLEKEDSFPVSSAILLEKQTKPKPLHTEASLLLAMETVGKEIENEAERNAIKECGIGTPATRASIIEILFSREYVVRKQKSLIPTSKGLKVFHAVKDKRIADVSMTGAWEKALSDIESGEMDHNTFDKSIAIYTKQITDELLKLDFPKSESVVFNCPKCQHESAKLYEKVVKCVHEGCGWLMFRKFCGIVLPEKEIKSILSSGKSSLIKGMKSQKNKRFDAFIVLNKDGSTNLEFPRSNYRSNKQRDKSQR